jgi:hypothetical protein
MDVSKDYWFLTIIVVLFAVLRIRKERWIMQKVINKKIYDTERAKLVAKYSNGLPISNFKHVYEDLYVTKKGQFFYMYKVVHWQFIAKK